MQIDADKFREIEAVEQNPRLPGTYPVIRLDGRGFSRLTKYDGDFDRPFDQGFRDAMIVTSEHLFECGFRIEFAYTQSDEISLLLHPQDDTFGRRIDKLLSVLAGEASARLSRELDVHAVMDARLLQIGREPDLVDYFVWRSLDAHRNALSTHAYWALRDIAGLPAARATERLEGASVSDKNEILFELGINFNDTPAWQKRGMALYWEDYEKVGADPRSGEERLAQRRRIAVDRDLPLGDDWVDYLRSRLESEI